MVKLQIELELPIMRRNVKENQITYLAVPVAAVTEVRNISNTDEKRALCKRKKNINYTIE